MAIVAERDRPGGEGLRGVSRPGPGPVRQPGVAARGARNPGPHPPAGARTPICRRWMTRRASTATTNVVTPARLTPARIAGRGRSWVKATKLGLEGRRQGTRHAIMYLAGPVLVRRPRRAHCDICTQKLLRAVSPVMPRVRAMSRAGHAWPGVERRMGQTAARRLVGWVATVGAGGGLERVVRLAGRRW